jgi:hypothetical protein
MKIAETATATTGGEKSLSRQDYFLSVGATIFCILFVAALLIICNGGIRIGFSNHSGLLPVVRRLLDANYLPNNFNIQLRLYHHRTFALLLAGLTKLLGEDTALLALSLVGNLLLSAAIFLLCRALKMSRLAFLAIGFVIAMNVGFAGHGLEENTFVGNREIQPPTFSHAFVLLGVAALLKDRFRLAALCAGLSLLFHLQIGLVFTLLLLQFFITRWRSFNRKEILLCCLLFLLPVALTLPDISQMMNRGLVNLPYTRADIDFRQPHHFALESWQAAFWVLGYVVLQAGIWLWLQRKRSEQRRGAKTLFLLSLMIVALSLIHFADYYLVQSNRISKFQFVRLSCLITVFGIFALVLFLNQLFKTKRSEVILNLVIFGLATMLYLIPATRQGAAYSFQISRYTKQQNDWVSSCLWIKEHTPVDVVFLTPPGEEGFTYLASRSNIGDFKTNPDGPQLLAEWYERLSDLAGGTLPQGKGFQNLAPLNQAYASLSTEQLLEIGKKYGAKYALIPQKSAAGLEVIYENKSYRVVKLNFNNPS